MLNKKWTKQFLTNILKILLYIITFSVPCFILETTLSKQIALSIVVGLGFAFVNEIVQALFIIQDILKAKKD